MRDDQSVAGMVDEVLERWAQARAAQTEESFEDALSRCSLPEASDLSTDG